MRGLLQRWRKRKANTVTIRDASGKKTTMDLATLNIALAQAGNKQRQSEAAQKLLGKIEEVEQRLGLPVEPGMQWPFRAERAVLALSEEKAKLPPEESPTASKE